MTTKMQDRIEVSFASVEGPQREVNHQVLQPILTDLIALSLMVKQLHWNVIGPNFKPIHTHLDEIYDLVQENIDDVAERLTATGHSPNGLLSFTAAKTELKEPMTGFMHGEEVLLVASQRLRETVGLIRSRMAKIEDKDTVTADLLHQICMGLEKHHWMIQAQRA